MLELPTGTVNSRLARALDDLRERERERDAERTLNDASSAPERRAGGGLVGRHDRARDAALAAAAARRVAGRGGGS